VTSILTNREAERLILDIRVGRAAGSADLDDGSGFVVFPTCVLVAVPGRGDNAFPLRTSAEPGVLCRDDGSATVSGVVDGVTVRGRFWWRLERGHDRQTLPPDEWYAFVRGGRLVPRPEWADQLPRSQVVAVPTSAVLARQRTRLVRRGEAAEHELLARTAKVFERSCRGPLRRAIATRPALDPADVVQRGLQAAVRLLVVYTSPARPPCSWLRMLRLDGMRDLHRAVSQLDWIPRDVGEIVARLEPADRASHRDPTVVLGAIIEAAVEHGRPVPRATPTQVRAALRAPRLVPLEAPGAGAGLSAGTMGRTDPGLEAAEEQRGALTAEVGRAVHAHPAQTARASSGDDVAIAEIGDLVLGALRRPGETKAMTRLRCRHLLATGTELSTGADGSGDRGGPGRRPRLTRIDAALAALLAPAG
jgi:hypothetical protein